MIRFSVVLLVLLCAQAVAAPGEDHWSADADTPFAAELAEARTLIVAEAFAEALPLLQRLATAEPGNADVFNLLGFAYRKTGDLARSAPAYARALRLKPDHLGALEYQGELFLRLGDLASAKANLARLRSLCPSPCEETDDLERAVADWNGAQAQ